MNVRVALVGLASGALLLTGACQTDTAGPGAATASSTPIASPTPMASPATAVTASRDGTIDVRGAMIEGVNPSALAIWDVGNAASDDYGGLDPAQMNPAAWAKLEDAAESLSTYAHRLATAEEIRASGPDLVGGKVPEGVASKAQIQAMIDSNPGGFRASATELERYADAIAAAAKARDLKTAGELVFTFDTTCQACHENYWYLKP